ncbi:unnamed protein product [Boreogadus saida]
MFREDPPDDLQHRSDRWRHDFDALYEELQQLGEGGFGSVFAGCRKEDRLPVRVTPQSHTLWKHTRV